MEEQAKAQETARRVQDATRRAQEGAREATGEATRMAGHLVSIGTETLGVWADVTQNIVHGMMDVSSRSSQEGARLFTELQQVGMDSLREMQTAAFRWQSAWPEAFRDPIRWYQRAAEESIGATRRSYGLGQRSAEAVTETLQRMQSSTEDATRTLQQAFRDAATKMQEVHERSERLRAA